MKRDTNIPISSVESTITWSVDLGFVSNGLHCLSGIRQNLFHFISNGQIKSMYLLFLIVKNGLLRYTYPCMEAVSDVDRNMNGSVDVMEKLMNNLREYPDSYTVHTFLDEMYIWNQKFWPTLLGYFG